MPIFLCYDARLKILPAILLIFLFASCASYHDSYKKGIFLKNDASMPVNGPTSALIMRPPAGEAKCRLSISMLRIITWPNNKVARIRNE
jgi:hypothetical protein